MNDECCENLNPFLILHNKLYILIFTTSGMLAQKTNVPEYLKKLVHPAHKIHANYPKNDNNEQLIMCVFIHVCMYV